MITAGERDRDEHLREPTALWVYIDIAWALTPWATSVNNSAVPYMAYEPELVA